MIVSKRFRFEASHVLPGYEGPCSRLHGHSYELVVSLAMPVDPETGMTMDFFALDEAVQKRVIDRLDHHHVNDLIENPTAENIVIWIWRELGEILEHLHEIELRETHEHWVRYRGD